MTSLSAKPLKRLSLFPRRCRAFLLWLSVNKGKLRVIHLDVVGGLLRAWRRAAISREEVHVLVQQNCFYITVASTAK